MDARSAGRTGEMKTVNIADARGDRAKEDAEKSEKGSQSEQRGRYNWKISYSFVTSAQQNVTLEYKSNYILCSYKDKLHRVCPADMQMLQQYLYKEPEPKDDVWGFQRYDYEESAERLDHLSDLTVDQPKLTSWQEYKRLVELSKLKPKKRPISKSILARIESQDKFFIGSNHFKPIIQASGVRRSIIKCESQKRILVANTNYVQFRNYTLKKVYKKIVTLQNVTARPVRFQIEGRPYRSNFRIVVNPVKESKEILPPGMQVRLMVLFRCDEVEDCEEVLIVNVEKGRPMIIRMRAFRDPPILQGICLLDDVSCSDSDSNERQLDQSWQPDMPTSLDSVDLSSSPNDGSTWQTDSSEVDKFISMTLDCKRGFVGETVYIPLKLKNIGGEGRFFVMSEIDWFTMDITDVTESNVLKLPCFTLHPAYFALKTSEEISFQMTFQPECFGIHVEKLYVLCDNGTLLMTEIIGDGVVYEPNFIRFSKQMEKAWPYKMNVDSRANYYISLGTSVPDGTGQCVITLSNVSEICVHFHWKKRDVRTEKQNVNEDNYFPLDLLHIKPESGVLNPIAVHCFTVTAEYKNLQPNYYFAILQLYLEDIPVAAISEKQSAKTKECTNRRRKCSSSVDVWVADIEVSLEYMVSGRTKTDRTSEELLRRITSIPSDYEYPGQEYYDKDDEEEEEEEAIETIEEVSERVSSCQLLIEELFSHHDSIDLVQFAPLWEQQIISLGIIRPTRTLHIGIEETYVLMLKNLANNALDYAWGEVNGLDSPKMKLCVCPEKGEVSAGQSQRMEITFLPIKEVVHLFGKFEFRVKIRLDHVNSFQGPVQSLFIPCFVGNSRKVIMLGIECNIEPLYVTFYFPLNDAEPVVLKNNFLRVEWRVDSLKQALDIAGKSRKNMKILDKYKMREERELMNADLDQGEVLKDASVGPSLHETDAEECGEQSTASTHTSEIIQMADWGSKTEKSMQDDISSDSIVPFFETFFPPTSQTVVVDFLKMSPRSVEKKTFIIKNETSIPTNFRLNLKNFYPVACSCEWKSQEERIKFIYKRIFGRCQKKMIEETLSRVKQPGSGIVIYVEPLSSDIGPYTAVPVDIYVFADTWGIYVDELEINISGLPQYTIGICVQVVGSPVTLSISDNSGTNVPVIKYGIQMVGSSMESRKIWVTNTSVLPIAIDWHTFLVTPAVETLPFNCVFNICTPFTDKLAEKLRASKPKTDNEIHLEKHASGWTKLKGLQSCDSYEISDISDTSNITTTSSYMSSSCMIISEILDDEILHNSEASVGNITKDTVESSTSSSTYEKNDNAMNRNVQDDPDMECKIALLPYYGALDTKIITVTPKEMFISPNDSASLLINIHLDRYRVINKIKEPLEGEFVCKILGLLRIAPTDVYKDNHYARQTGTYFPPIEIDITANVVRAKLEFDIPKFDRTFTCSASEVMQSKKKKVEITRTFFLYNNENNNMEISFETCGPFHIKSVSIYAGTNPCKPGSICIHAHGTAEVEILCIIEAQLIQTIIHTTTTQELHDSKIVLREPLYIIHSDKQYQVIELILEILLPVVKLSSYTLDFGLVYVGDVKKLTLIIKNLSKSSTNFKVNQKLNNKDFEVDKNSGELFTYYGTGEWTFTLTISFHPKIPGQSFETLEIVTDIPYYSEECQLYGEGTLDEKYHTPGV